MLVLHYCPGACSIAAHILLEESGLPYAVRPVHFAKGDHLTPEFRAINPLAQVPVLESGSVRITQNVAILTYIADQAPQAGLLPTEPLARAEALSLLGFLSSEVHSAFAAIFGAGRLVASESAQAELVASRRARLDELFRQIDGRLAGRTYAIGDRFGVCDAYLTPFFRWASLIGMPTDPYPHYVAHQARVSARPAVQRVDAREESARAAA